jgi:hypothetical protein
MKFIIPIVLILGLFACSGTNQKSLEDSFASFVQSNNKIVGFGSIRIKDILLKADYTKIPKYGPLLASQLAAFSGTVDFEKPLYFALEGPFDKAGYPAALYLFAESKNQDSVTSKLKSFGFDMIKNEEGKFNYYQDREFSISVKESLLVGVLKPKTTEFKGLLAKIYDQSSLEVKEDKIKEFVQTKSDIVAGINLEALYGTSNTDLEKLPKDKKQSLISMVKGSFVLNSLNFNAGELELKTQNFFSTALTQNLPLKNSGSSDIIKKIGSGEPRLGLLFNFDFQKLNSFMEQFNLQDEYSEIAKNLTGQEISTKEIFGEILNGQFGVVAYDEMMEEGGMTPVGNLFVGFGKQGKQGFEKLNVPGIGLLKKDILDSHALFYLSDKFKPSDEQIKVPQGCENFGMKPISGYAYLEGLPIEDFELEEEFKFIEKIDHIYFEYGLEGGVLKVRSIDSKTNFLKQSVDQALTQLSEMLIKMVL